VGAGWIIIDDVAAIARLAELERQPISCCSLDDELSEVDRTVVEVADRDEVLELVPASVTLILHMVNIESHIAPAPRHDAAVPIACQHLLALPRRHRLGGTLRRLGIQRTQMDSVTCGALGHDRMPPPMVRLPPPPPILMRPT
jgi:hypothetical protein